MPSSHKKTLLCLCGVAAFIFLLFLPCLKADFVNWDDDVHLLENPFVPSLSPEGLKDIFTTTVNQTYIPLTTLSFALEYLFFQDSPFIYHFNNLLLHIAISLLVFVFARGLGLNRRAGLAAALVFGIHPMHVESVAWVSERKDVLYGFFYMLAMIFYLAHIQSRSRAYKDAYVDPLDADQIKNFNPQRINKWYFTLTLAAGFLSVLAKPMAVSLPLTLLACDWLQQRRIGWAALAEKIVVGLSVIPIALITYQFQARPFDFQWPQSVLTWVWSFVFYLQKFIYPDYYVLIYKLPQPVGFGNPAYLSAVAVFVLLLVLVVVFRRSRLFVFALMLYVASVFFLLRWDTVADTNVVADRFMYLPSLGICLFAGYVFDQFMVKWRPRKSRLPVLWAAAAVVIGILAVQTFRQVAVWHSGVRLWKHQLRYQPQAATALSYNKLAEATIRSADFRQQLERIRRKRATPEDRASAHAVLTLLEQALRIKADYGNAYFNRALLWQHLGEDQKALNDLAVVNRIDPQQFDAYVTAGNIYLRQGRLDDAAVALDRALGLSPENAKLYSRILALYQECAQQGPDAGFCRDQFGKLQQRMTALGLKKNTR